MSAECRNCGKGLNHLDHSRGICEYEPVGKEPKKQKALAPRSPKMATFYREQRIPLVELVMARDRGMCQILSPWHERIADWNPPTVHEIRPRGREGGIMAEGVNDPANCVVACLRCNQAMQENSDWAEANGWLEPASEVSK